MGIRFACHGCGRPLHIKQSLAGKRGICPDCRIRFRIPLQDTPKSSPIETASHAATGEDSSDRIGSVGSSSGPTNVAPVQSGDHESRDALPTDSPTTKKPTTAVASSLTIMDDDSTATWYVRPPAGGQYGPADRETLLQWIHQGRVASSALLWRDGWPQWRTAADALPDMAIQLAAAQPPPTLTDDRSTSGQSLTDAAVRPGMNTSKQSSGSLLTGESALGATKAKASRQRVLVVAVLTATLLGLIAVLVFVLLPQT